MGLFSLFLAALPKTVAQEISDINNGVLHSYHRLHMLPIENMLSNQRVQAITQDRQGFIWIGSNSGLFKYDGYTYTHFRNHPSDSTSLIHNFVHAIMQDRDKPVLWVATMEGLSRFNMHTEEFKNYYGHIDFVPPDPDYLDNTDIFELAQDHEGNIWLGCHSGVLLRFDPETDQFIPVELDKEVCNGGWEYWTIEIDTLGDVWCRCQNAVFRVNPQTLQAQNFADEIGSPVNLTVDKRNGNPWFLISNGIIGYNQKSEEFANYRIDFTELLQPYGINDISVFRNFLIDRHGNFWMSSFFHQLLFKLELDREGSHRFWSISGSEGYQIGRFLDIFEDNSGTIWFGFWKGLGFIDPYLERFKYVEDGNYPFRYANIQSIKEDSKGNIWYSPVDNGIAQFQPKTGKIESFLPFPRIDRIEPLALHVLINAMLPNDQMLVTVGNEIKSEGLQRKPVLKIFDTYTTDFQDISSLSDAIGFPPEYAYNGTLPNRDLILLEKDQVQYLFDPLTKEITSLAVPKEFENAKLNQRILFHPQFRWYSFDQGLLRIHNENGDYQFSEYNPFIFNPQDSNTLSGARIKVDFEDKNGNLWIATEYTGLSRLVWERESYRPYFIHWRQDNSGLPSDEVLAIEEDRTGHLWISLQTGIARLDPEKNEFESFSIEETGQSFYTWGQSHQSADGTIFFAGAKGLTFFHPDNIWIDTIAPEIVITGFAINNQPVAIPHSNGDHLSSSSPLDQHINFTESVTLSYAQNDFSLSFATLDFSLPEKNKYEFKLEGYHDDWVYTDASQRTASFTNIKPGDYTFKVRGTNVDGIWSTSDATIQITILPPWWVTWWAYTIYAIMAFYLLYFIYRFQLNRKLAKAEALRLKELDHTKTRLYTNITHEFRTPLTVILGISDQIGSHSKVWLKDGAETIKRNANHLLRLVNQMLDLAKIESGFFVLREEQGDIVRFLKYITESYSSFAQSKDIRLHFKSVEKPLYMDYDCERLTTVMSNLISNAVQYTPSGGDVYVSVEEEAAVVNKGKENMRCSIKVKDTGSGIPEEKLPHIFDRFYQAKDPSLRSDGGTGIGLALCKELVQLMRGQITVKSELEKGTEFIIYLPITRSREMGSFSAVPEGIVRKTGSVEIESGPQFRSKETPLVLLIEDNRDLVQYIVSILEPDYHVEIAHNGQEGIDKAFELIPDIVISDVMMPLKDGFEVCESLKLDERTSHIPVILLTAKVDLTSKIEGLQRGADAYLSKPFNQKELTVRIKKLIELRELLRQRYEMYAVSGDLIPSSDLSLNIEDQFMTKLNTVIISNYSDDQFAVGQLAQAMTMSRTQLTRKIKVLTGKTPVALIRSRRLSQAKSMLLNSSRSVSEIAFECGFRDPAYFTRVFSKEFGCPPSQYRTRRILDIIPDQSGE